MRILSYLALVATVVFFGSLVAPAKFTFAGEAKEEAAFKYVGANGCKFCHAKEKNGMIYEMWESSLHAKAFESLGEANQGNAQCLACHTTGYGKAIAAGATAENLRGVQCEACHGPGSDYKAMKVMKDHAMAVEKGLIEASEKLCRGCHTADLPNECWKGAEAAPKFDFAAAYKQVEHHVPKQ